MADTFICPICGTEVEIDALVCPECGSDDETGWSDRTAYDGLYFYEDEDLNSGRESKPRPWLKYLIPGLIIVTLSAFLSAVVPWGIYLLPVILLAAGIAFYLMEVAPKRQFNQIERLYQALLTRAQGDYGMVERWISYERRREPDADEIQLMQSALYRWQRDNR